MQLLRTNTATRVTVGPFLDKTDGVTPETAITVTSEKLTFVVDDGGVPTLVLDTAPTASGGANDMVHITGDDAGYYDLELAAANVNYLGRAKLALTDAATHCPVFHEFMIIPASVYDSLVLGTDNLQVDTIQWLGTACATPTVAGVPEVDVTHVGGDAQSATDLKDFADAGYDPATNKVEGVKLADTLTTYTGNTPQTGDTYPIASHVTYGNSALKTLIDAVDDYIDTEIAAIKAVTDNLPNSGALTTITTHLTDIKGATFSGATDSLEAIRDRGDAAWITATGFSTHSAADVWAVATRALTDKTGFAIGTGGITSLSFAAGAIDAAAIAADAIGASEVAADLIAEIWAKVVESQGNITAQQAMSIMLGVLAGVTADNGATVKTPNGVATRVAATIDANQNRTAMTLTPSS